MRRRRRSSSPGSCRGTTSPGRRSPTTRSSIVESPPPYVSRAGHKLANALDAFGLDVAGLDCCDVGASTGGFTDVLLQRGARRVIALDVGYGQLHPRLRGDPRVVVMERTNARHVTELPFAPQLVTCDVSFISATLALPPILRLAAPGWQALVLVKPQFEAGRAEATKGVVRDAAVQRRVVREVAEAALGWGARDGRRRRLGPARAEGQPGVRPPPRAATGAAPSRRHRQPDRRSRWLSPCAARALFLRERDGFESALARVRGRRAQRSGVELVDDDPRARRRARRRRHDAARVPRVPRPRAGDRRQLRPLRLSRVDPAGRARGGPAARLRRRLRRHRAADARVRAAGSERRRGQRRRRRQRRRSAGWSSSSGRSAASRSAPSRATGSSSPRPAARPRTTCRTTGPCSCGGSTRWRCSFVAPHSLHARPLVVPRGRDIVVTNRTPDIPLALIADGQRRRRDRAGRHRHRPARRRTEPARDAARRDVPDPLPALPSAKGRSRPGDLLDAR